MQQNDAENWCVKNVLNLNHWKGIMCTEKALLPLGELAIDENDNNNNKSSSSSSSLKWWMQLLSSIIYRTRIHVQYCQHLFTARFFNWTPKKQPLQFEILACLDPFRVRYCVTQIHKHTKNPWMNRQTGSIDVFSAVSNSFILHSAHKCHSISSNWFEKQCNIPL